MTGDSLEFYKSSGFSGAKTIDSMIDQVEAAGWTKGSERNGISADGSSAGSNNDYISPDGQLKFSYTKYYGSTSYDNSFSFTFKPIDMKNESLTDGFKTDKKITRKFDDLIQAMYEYAVKNNCKDAFQEFNKTASNALYDFWNNSDDSLMSESVVKDSKLVWDLNFNEIIPNDDDSRDLAYNAEFLLNEYINYMAKSYYTNGNMPEDEEQDIRDNASCVYSEFTYHDEDEGEDLQGNLMFIIDTSDGSLMNFDTEMAKYIPDDVFEEVKKLAYYYIDVEMGNQHVPINESMSEISDKDIVDAIPVDAKDGLIGCKWSEVDKKFLVVFDGSAKQDVNVAVKALKNKGWEVKRLGLYKKWYIVLGVNPT